MSHRIITALELSGVPQTKIRPFYPVVYTGAKRSVDATYEKHPYSALFLGRLISAFETFENEGLTYLHLVIAGDGPLSGMVSSAAFNKSIIVSFGNVYGDEKWKLFSGCDLFVYSDEDHISILGRMK